MLSFRLTEKKICLCCQKKLLSHHLFSSSSLLFLDVSNANKGKGGLLDKFKYSIPSSWLLFPKISHFHTKIMAIIIPLLLLRMGQANEKFWLRYLETVCS